MNKYIKLEGFALKIAEEWAEKRTEAARKGKDLKSFDIHMRHYIILGIVGMDMADEIVEAAIEMSDIQIKAAEYARQRREIIEDGFPLAEYDPVLRRAIFFGNLDEEKTEEIFRLAVELSERKGFR